MKIKEAIKGIERLVIVKNGKIMGIKNECSTLRFGKSIEKTSIVTILNSTVKDTHTIKGVIADVIRFSI